MYDRSHVINYPIMSSIRYFPHTTFYFPPSNIKFVYIRIRYIPKFTTVHVRTKSRMYFVQCFTITNAKVTDDTVASLLKITSITYNIPVINIG